MSAENPVKIHSEQGLVIGVSQEVPELVHAKLDRHGVNNIRDVGKPLD